MAEENNKAEELSVIEGQDGSATVDLPENMAAPDVIEADAAQQNDDNQSQNGQNDDQAIDDDVRNAKRERRRAKKELIRKTNQEKDLRLQQLERENSEFRRREQELRGRMDNIERNVKAEEVTRIEKSIDDANTRLEYAKMKLAEATQNQDGQAMVEAQTLWQDASNQVRELTAMQQQAKRQMQTQRQTQNVQLPDAKVQRMAADWMKRNSWYDPSANDRDSQVAKKMDELLSAQGMDPSDPDYWEELDFRLQKELPHRYNGDNDDDNRDVRRPRNVVASSGREASEAYGGTNRNQFVLSPDRVKAMKDAGAWDNPERKARMIKQFIAYDRANSRN
jgi:chromosome segregation ATPase